MQGRRARDNMPLLLSFDAYNGVSYWEREMPGASRIYILGDCGNLACSRDGLFVAGGTQCQRLDLVHGPAAAQRTLCRRGPAGRAGPGLMWAWTARPRRQFVAGLPVQRRDLRLRRADGRPEMAPPGFGDPQQHDRHPGEPRVLRRAPRADEGPGRAGSAGPGQARGGQSGTAAAAKDAAPPPTPPARPAARRRHRLPRSRTCGPWWRSTWPRGKELWSRDVNLAGCGSWTGSLCLIAKDDVLVLVRRLHRVRAAHRRRRPASSHGALGHRRCDAVGADAGQRGAAGREPGPGHRPAQGDPAAHAATR